MLLELPTDVLEEITKKLTHDDQGRLRAGCRALEGLTQRLFFSCVIVRTGKHLLQSHNLDLELFRALATGKTGWNVHARRIVFIPGPYVSQERKKLDFLRFGREKKRQSRQREAEALLKSALATMMNVRAIFWRVTSRDVLSQQEVITDFVSRIPVLDEMCIDITRIQLDFDPFTPPSVSGVRRFELTAFPWDDETSTRHPITHLIQSQERLKCLDLHGRKEWTEVWLALREARIHLTDISTNIVSPDFFKYLLSYTGLRKLDFGFQDAGSQAEDDRLADQFYGSVILHHADTLVELSCSSRYEGRFSFGEHNVHVVSQLRRLSALSMSVNAGDDVGLETDQDLASNDPDIFVDTTVNLLLNTAATSLPALRHLTICAADLAENRGVMCFCCGNTGVSRLAVVNRGIARAVTGFWGRLTNPFEVGVGGEVYGLRLVKAEEDGLGGLYECYLKGKAIYD